VLHENDKGQKAIAFHKKRRHDLMFLKNFRNETEKRSHEKSVEDGR
jgi:hypothetical protein